MSGQLVILNELLRLAVRPRLATVTKPGEARRDFDLFSQFFLRLASDVTHTVEPGRPPLHRFSPGAVKGSHVIMYFHGGGYMAGSPRTHAALAGALARASGCEVVLPDYRLAPENPAPAALEDACAAHANVLDRVGAPDRIVLGGDSAGGGLALSLLADLCARGERPAAAFAFSPWVDMTLSGASLRENADTEAYLPANRMELARDLVIGSLAPEDPRVSPLFAAFEAPPPVQIHVGRSEILRDDARAMAEHLRNAGGQVELDERPEVPHAWPIFCGYVPEADETVASVARFLGRA
ncbi:alpha/beta hydrolase [Tropicimonas isoalkanivorans]|uniref:Acetyl esterase/lipase n=1 Tax=Tropicimonas isoalkanivorans TaxID=441112 RepID=A0A1I1JCS4_9RHOB|nr:alpha/beta hydrolase [Tropicimonas isoalkanivorans]SFC46344.1 Acetyl esterase/lipase [Tropicimonas isoalkanivorans]